ncbi:Conserved_hypothetical protein [Hexamita inflata]|uniref:Uncharacterized protein n=1 Tax=Hexamita inflata TaxID=28002 RepID=A0AA86R8I6_9EUKA|nr:Conserved hypothetical protein [Hexamita inflata]
MLIIRIIEPCSRQLRSAVALAKNQRQLVQKTGKLCFYSAHEFQIIEDGQIIAAVKKAWFTWGESFEIEVQSGQAELVIATVVAIHQAMHRRSSHF